MCNVWPVYPNLKTDQHNGRNLYNDADCEGEALSLAEFLEFQRATQQTFCELQEAFNRMQA